MAAQEERAKVMAVKEHRRDLVGRDVRRALSEETLRARYTEISSLEKLLQAWEREGQAIINS